MRTIYLYGQPRVVALRAGTQACPYLVWIILFGLLGLITSGAVAEEGGFKPIFDGKTLKGWQAPDMSYWSVQDGTITARATQQHPVKKNQFLVWQFGELDDFELKLKYRISGTSSANSGVQIRSRVEEDGHAVGYQADVDLGGRWAGALYDEGGRRMLAERGQKTVIGSDGKMTSTSIADSDSLFANIKKDNWNDYHIIARGAHIVLKINGKVTAEVIDNDKRDRELSGVLALQLHSGPPMTVRFKDIRLKRLKLQDRKKIVLVAGPGSHRYGSHEHNAGCLLLAKLLNENMPRVYAAVYTNGWPKDPTAFDNADAIAIYCDGGGRHVVMPHLEEVDELVKKGVGLAFIHYAVTVPKGEGGNCLLDWIGGYYETYWSVNPHWQAEFKKLPRHPITRGVRPFSINDEWYYHMRFAENMQNVTPILTAIPPDSTRKRRDGAHSGNPHVRARMGMPEHVAWVYERPAGGRGFGFAGGHWHWNWAHDDFRKLVLNALVWITGAEVPASGVPSKRPSVEELEANQDYPKPKNWNREKIQQDIKRWNQSLAVGVIYRNPRVYNVDHSFELVPDPAKIDRAKDLKLWLPIPREWDSQKAVKIISVQPPPHAKYEEPEHGNRMLFWDFGKGPEKPYYKVDIKFRLESYEIHVEVDPERVGRYDKTSKEYGLYTRSTHTVSITPKIKELAQIAVGDEKNPYLQAERIFKFVRQKMRYKILDYERGRGIKCLLDYPVIDEETGEEYYEGCCSQYSAFFCALCRATGIPARAVFGFRGFRPWITEEQLKPLYEFETKLSPDGLAGVQHFGNMHPHMWAEFLVPGYGWVIADAQTGRFCHQDNGKVILNKGRDIQIGPDVQHSQRRGYGSQWVLLHDGRADYLFSAVWNIANVDSAKVKVFHSPDPFPAYAFTEYTGNLYPEIEAEKKIVHYQLGVLSWIDETTREESDKGIALTKAYQQSPRRRYNQEQYLCHMLRQVVGDKKFFKIFDTYTNLRVSSCEPVSTERFQKIVNDVYGKPLDWFFEQWLEREELPELRLEDVIVLKEGKGWHIQGSLCQLSDLVFRLPVELELETEKQKALKTIWVETKKASFKFSSPSKPKRIIVDPKLNILKIQKMPSRLGEFWNAYPEIIVVYSTLSEGKANKAAAERFNNEYLRLGQKIIKADVDVNEADLKARCLILVGRPETNKIAQQFKDIFPIKFDEDKFTWQGITYAQPTQGVAQVIENPNDTRGLMMIYAGLSPEAIQKFGDLHLYNADASYIIFDGDKELLRGDWKVDSNLYWNFDTHPSVR